MNDHIEEVAGFINQEEVVIKDKETGKTTTLYKTHFLTSDKKLLTYWLQFKIEIESSLPAVKILMDRRISNEGKLELKISDVVVM